MAEISVTTMLTFQKLCGVIGIAFKMNHHLGYVVVGKGRYSQICVFGTFLAPKTENVIKNHNHSPKTPRKKAQSSVVGSTSKMIFLQGAFIVRKVRCGQVCAVGALKTENVGKDLNHTQKHQGNEMQSSVVGRSSKMIYL